MINLPLTAEILQCFAALPLQTVLQSPAISPPPLSPPLSASLQRCGSILCYCLSGFSFTLYTVRTAFNSRSAFKAIVLRDGSGQKCRSNLLNLYEMERRGDFLANFAHPLSSESSLRYSSASLFFQLPIRKQFRCRR